MHQSPYSRPSPLRYAQILAVVLWLCVLLWPVPALAAEPPRWHTFTSDNGLAGNIVQSVWEDPSGAIWFGTENGVSRYDGRAWQTYRTDAGLLDNNVWSLSGDGDSVWCATSSGLSQFRAGRWRSFSTTDGLPGNDVRAVLVAADGTVWAGTFGQGIGRLLPGASRWEAFPQPANAAGRGIFVQAIWQAPDGTLWFSTNGDGALRLRNGALERFSFRSGSRNTVWGVGGSADSPEVWMATFRGIVRVADGDGIVVVDAAVGGVALAETEVLAVAGGSGGELWFGTRASGVFRLRDGVWERFTTADGLARNYVQFILADRSGRLWLGTRGGGVTLLDRGPLPNTLVPRIGARDIRSGEVVPLDGGPLDARRNNLQFTLGVDAPWLPPQDVRFSYWLERDGAAAVPRSVQSGPAPGAAALTDLYVALVPGSYRLHVVAVAGDRTGSPEVVRFSIRSAPPALSADTLHVQVAGQSLAQGLTLPQALLDTPRRVELRFAATDDATGPADLRYRYRLARPGAAWNEATGASAALELTQGTYTIEAQAIDGDGNLSEPVQVAVIVPGPFWQTLLLYLLLILVPGTAGGFAGAIFYRRLARRQALRRAVSGYLIPYDVGSLITVPDRYIGRRHVIDTVLGKIANNSFYVYGEKRIGKTSLLLQIRQRLDQRGVLGPGQRLISVFRNIQDVPEQRFWHYLVRSIAAELGGPLPPLLADGDEASYDDLDAESDLETLVAYAAGDDRPPQIVLLLDEVDTLQRYHPAVRQRFRAFCQHTQGNLRVVLAGVLPPRADLSDTSPWYNIFERIALGPLDRSDILFLIRSYNHNPYGYTADAEQAVLAAGDGKPFDTQWLCSEAVKCMLADRRTTVTLADVEQATAAVVRERSAEFAACWQLLAPDVQTTARGCPSGLLPPEPVPGSYDPLVAAGLVLTDGEDLRLTALFRRWIEKTPG